MFYRAKGLVFSILLHVLGCALILKWVNFQHPMGPEIAARKIIWVSDFKTAVAQTHLSNGSANGKKGGLGSGKKSIRGFQLQDSHLLTQLSNPFALVDTSKMHFSGINGAGEKAAKDSEGTGGLDSAPFYGADHWASLKQLKDRVEETLIYPEALMRSRKEGSVTFSFVLNENGKVTGPIQIVNASDRYLKVYALRLLEKVLKDFHFSQKLVLQKSEKLLAVFKFSLAATKTGLEIGLPEVERNILRFYRGGVGAKEFVQGNFNPEDGQVGLQLNMDFDYWFDSDIRKAHKKFKASEGELDVYRRDPLF